MNRVPKIRDMAEAKPLATLARTVRESGLVAEGSRGVVLVSGGADSAAAAAGLVEALGGDSVIGAASQLRPAPGLGPRPGNLRGALRGARHRVGGGHAGAGHGKRAGRGPGDALRGRGAAAARPRARLDRHRPHPHGPGRDGALPARHLARSPGPARAPSSPRHDRPSDDRRGPRSGARPGGRGGVALPGRSHQRRAPLRAQQDSQRGAAGAPRDRPRGGRDDRGDTRRVGRGGGNARRAGRGGARRIGGRRLRGRSRGMSWPRWTRRSGGWRCAGWPRRAAGEPVPLGRSRAAEIWRLVNEPEGGVVELGGGVEARAEHGHVRFSSGRDAEPAEATLVVPGICRFGSWEVRAELERGAPAADSPDLAVLDPDGARRLGHGAIVARGRPDATARARRHQVPAGPLHRPQGARGRCGMGCRS